MQAKLKLKPLGQSAILAALSYFVLEKIWTGRLSWYINERYLLLTLAGALGLAALALVNLLGRRNDVAHTHDHSVAEEQDHINRFASLTGALWLILALPAVLGLLVPARPLGSSAVANKGVSGTAPLTAGGNTQPAKLDLAPNQRTILDWVRAFNYESDPSIFNGQPADVIGFVFHDARLDESQFFVGRFAITCCVAYASAIGMIVDWPKSAALPDNTWVRVQGMVNAASLDGRPIAQVQASGVEVVPEPANPYLYP